MKLRIGWDIDGVGHVFWHGVRRYCEAEGYEYDDSTFIDDDACCWNFPSHWGWDGKAFKYHMDRAADLGYIFSEGIREGYMEATHMSHMLGHRNVAITDRSFGSSPFVSQHLTYRWVRDNGVLFHELHFSADKTVVPTDLFIEDKLENYDALDAAGVEVYLLTRPWNNQNDNRRRIEHVNEYKQIIIDKTPSLVFS